MVDELTARLDEALRARGFRRRESPGVDACWVRRTWNTNRAVVLLRCPEGEDPALYARAERAALRGRASRVAVLPCLPPDRAASRATT